MSKTPFSGRFKLYKLYKLTLRLLINAQWQQEQKKSGQELQQL